MASAGAGPVWRASSASESPSSSPGAQVATRTSSKPSAPMETCAPALAGDQALVDDAPPRRAVGQALEQPGGAAVVGPRRQRLSIFVEPA